MYQVDERGDWLDGVERRPAADLGGRLWRPEVLLIHYTAGAGREGDLAALTRSDDVYVSAHFHVGRSGRLTQLAPLTRVAWHAGVSEWGGRENLNGWSIGVEFENWGPVRLVDGIYRSWTGAEVDAGRVTAAGGGFWESYGRGQLWTGLLLMQALARRFDLKWVLGHSDVSPGRKVDPGPAFPLGCYQRVLSTVGKRGDPREAAK